MATCPNCNKHIDDDSYYCEHCGTKLYACPKCHTIGKGENKCCGQCGTKLVEASSIGLNTPPPPPPTPSSLFCAAMNIRIPLLEGALIGRTTGNYVQQLSVCKYISGRHATLNKTTDGWTITDLGSTNGTKVNGIPCAPTLPFTIGSIVRIGNYYDFIAE